MTLTSVTAAPNSHTHSYGSSTALTTSANSGDAVAAITGLGATTYYLAHSHTAASASGTKNVAPHTHTHSYGSSAALTTGENSGTNFNAITGITSNGTATVVTGVTGGTYTFTTKYLKHSHTATTGGSTADAVTEVAANGTKTVLTGVKASGTVEAYTGLETEAINVATTTGSLPSLTYDTESVGSASGWSRGSLPTQGSAQTVVTSVSAELPETTVTSGGSGTLTTNTPS